MESAVDGRTALSGGHSSRPERVWGSLYTGDNLCQSVFSSLARSDFLSGHTSSVEWLDRARPSRRVTLVASATVYVQSSRRPLRPVGAWTDPTTPWAADLWLPDRPHQPPARMFRTARLGRLVQRDMREVSVPIGVSDFEGRSFRGRHHHTTLVSVAHAASLLTEAGDEEYARLRPPAQQALHSRAEPVPAPRRAGADRVLRMPTS